MRVQNILLEDEESMLNSRPYLEEVKLEAVEEKNETDAQSFLDRI